MLRLSAQDRREAMKKFTISCDFSGVTTPFNAYVGAPARDAHPLEQQAAWLQRVRGGVVPVGVMDTFQRLHDIALENEVSFEELCAHALGTAQTANDDDAHEVVPPDAEADVA
jgi:hypothetical protein